MQNNKSKLTILGMDNGTTGTLACFKDGVLFDFRESFSKVWRKPTVRSKNSYMNRIDFDRLKEWILSMKKGSSKTIAVIERSMTDQKRFNATISSHHAQEAIMIALETCGIQYMTVDSKVWQSKFLSGVSGSFLLKQTSMNLGKQEFPQYSGLIEKHGDADAIFIAKTAVDFPALFVEDENLPLVEDKRKVKRKFSTNFKQ